MYLYIVELFELCLVSLPNGSVLSCLLVKPLLLQSAHIYIYIHIYIYKLIYGNRFFDCDYLCAISEI